MEITDKITEILNEEDDYKDIKTTLKSLDKARNLLFDASHPLSFMKVMSPKQKKISDKLDIMIKDIESLFKEIKKEFK